MRQDNKGNQTPQDLSIKKDKENDLSIQDANHDVKSDNRGAYNTDLGDAKDDVDLSGKDDKPSTNEIQSLDPTIKHGYDSSSTANNDIGKSRVGLQKKIDKVEDTELIIKDQAEQLEQFQRNMGLDF